MLRTIPTEYREGYKPNLYDSKYFYRFTIVPIKSRDRMRAVNPVYNRFFHIYTPDVKSFMKFLYDCSKKKWKSEEDRSYVGAHRPGVFLFIKYYDVGIDPHSHDTYSQFNMLTVEGPGCHRPDISNMEDLNANLITFPKAHAMSFCDIPEFQRHGIIIRDNLKTARTLIIRLVQLLFPVPMGMYSTIPIINYIFFFKRYMSSQRYEFDRSTVHFYDYYQYETDIKAEEAVAEHGGDYRVNAIIPIKYILPTFITNTTIEEFEPIHYIVAHLNINEQRHYNVANAQSIEEYVARQQHLCNCALLRVAPTRLLIDNNLLIEN